MATPSTWTLDELATLTGLAPRTVRYYIQIGLVDRPEGETRAARYGERHLEQLSQIRRWSDAGLSLERIRELLAGAAEEVPARPHKPGSIEVWSRLFIADGVELSLEPGRADLSPEQVRMFSAAVMQAFVAITQNKDTGEKS